MVIKRRRCKDLIKNTQSILEIVFFPVSDFLFLNLSCYTQLMIAEKIILFTSCNKVIEDLRYQNICNTYFNVTDFNPNRIINDKEKLNICKLINWKSMFCYNRCHNWLYIYIYIYLVWTLMYRYKRSFWLILYWKYRKNNYVMITKVLTKMVNSLTVMLALLRKKLSNKRKKKP